MVQTIYRDYLRELLANRLRERSRILAKGSPDERIAAHKLREHADKIDGRETKPGAVVIPFPGKPAA